MIGCESYSVPEYVREHVDLIKPTVHFVHRIPDDPALLRKRATVKPGDPSSFNGPKTNGDTVTELLSLATCDRFTTLECLRKLYSINYKPQVPDKNSFGIGVSFFREIRSPDSDTTQSNSLRRLILAKIWICSSR
jgi:tripeptidyl-peptidase-1